MAVVIWEQRLQERDERKQAFKDRKEDEATLKLLNVIKVSYLCNSVTCFIH